MEDLKSFVGLNIQYGLKNNLIEIDEEKNRIKYNCSREYETTFKNPEEKIRASYFVELIRDYKYPNSRIDIEVKVERRTPDDRADIVVYEDEKTKPKGKYYEFQIGTNETATEVFERIDAIYEASKKGNGEVFNVPIKLKPKIVYAVVEHLQEISINKTDLDTKGVAFEMFMEDFFKGKMGQFFTPRNIIKFMVDLIQPEHSDKLLDPACGSGGFLLNSLDLIRKYAEENHDQLEAYSIWHNFAKDNLFGIEINDQIARVCKMNMIIHDDGHTNVIAYDGLERFEKIENQHKDFKENSFDYILTNPPFGATVKSTEKELGFIEQFELGGKSKKRKNQKTEVLFIERSIEFLKKGTGIMGVVLPDSITINTSLQFVRDFILNETQLLGVISLPGFTFSHYGAKMATV